MSIDIVYRGRARTASAGGLRAATRCILESLGRENYDLSIALVDNREIRKLNARYRQKDQPTDVLAFPADPNVPGAERLLGDVVISVEQARRQARENKRPLKDELRILLIHGILHLLGYDHERSTREAKTMQRLEKRIFRQLCERRDLGL